MFALSHLLQSILGGAHDVTRNERRRAQPGYGGKARGLSFLPIDHRGGSHSPQIATLGSSPLADCAAVDEFARQFQKTSRIQHVVRHNGREVLGGVQRGLSLLLYSHVHFYTIQANL